MKKKNNNKSSNSINVSDMVIVTSHSSERGTSSLITQPPSNNEEITAADIVFIDNEMFLFNDIDDVVDEDIIEPIEEPIPCVYGPPLPYSECEECVYRHSCIGDVEKCLNGIPYVPDVESLLPIDDDN